MKIIRADTADLIRKAGQLARKAAELDAGVNDVTLSANIAFVTMAESGAIDEVTATEHLSAFAPWKPSVSYAVGQLRVFPDKSDNPEETAEQKLYKCVQAHTSQSDWTPDKTPALWVLAGDPADEWPEWSQPIGSQDAYEMGDKVSHNGAHWTSNVDANVWEPGVYGWTEV